MHISYNLSLSTRKWFHRLLFLERTLPGHQLPALVSLGHVHAVTAQCNAVIPTGSSISTGSYSTSTTRTAIQGTIGTTTEITSTRAASAADSYDCDPLHLQHLQQQYGTRQTWRLDCQSWRPETRAPTQSAVCAISFAPAVIGAAAAASRGKVADSPLSAGAGSRPSPIRGWPFKAGNPCSQIRQQRLLSQQARRPDPDAAGPEGAGTASRNNREGEARGPRRGSAGGGGGCDGGDNGDRSARGEGGAATATAGGGGGGGDSRALPLRAALRLLFKRVHPDLFHDQPLAKEENERSFKLLQEYVQLARGGDPRSPAARLPYRFAFYLRQAPERVELEPEGSPAVPLTAPRRPPTVPQTAAAQTATSATPQGAGVDDPGDIPGLHLVRVVLPPPAISSADAKDLAGPTRKALVKLLAACGLATSGRDSEGAGEAGGGEAEGSWPLSLAAFLPEAVEALRQAEAARPSDPAVRVANLRGAMRLHHQVMVSFSDKQLPAARQVALLERLAGVVGSAGPELRLQGCHIVIGDRLGLDRLGQLCLAASEPDDAWIGFLTGVDMDFVRHQRRTVEGLRNLEQQVARAAGVAQIFTPYGNLTEPSYREFLERLAAAAAARGPLGGGTLQDVSLCALPPLPDQPGQPRAPLCRLDDTSPGVIQVSTDALAADVYGGVARLAGQAQAAVLVRKHEEADLKKLSDKTRQMLRMRSLTRDPRIAPAHFCRACGLLLEQATALMPLLEGCTVRIGFANRLAPDGSCIEIAYNFEL